MGAVVELERRSEAIEPGDAVVVGAASTAIAAASDRKVIVLSNGSDENIWVRLAADGAALGDGICVFAGSGVALREYSGALCGICASGGKSLGVTEY